MLKERLIESFKELGFDEYREIKSSDIVFSEDVFSQCAKNTCGHFGKNHACPSKTENMDERKAKVLKYQKAFIISKIAPIGSRKEMLDSMELIAGMNKKLSEAFEAQNVFVMGAGPCTTCKNCTALEGNPCRFPEKIQYSMEGSGIDVVRMARNHKMTYNAGKGKVGFFTLVLYNE